MRFLVLSRILRCRFLHNRACLYGGALGALSGELTIRESVFDNQTTSGVYRCGGTIDVNGATTAANTLCAHFCKFFSCRYGDNCKFTHPENIKKLIKDGTLTPTRVWGKTRKKRGICRAFAAGKPCKYGDKCMFQHVTPEANTASITNIDVDVSSADFHFDVSMINIVTDADPEDDQAEVTATTQSELTPADFNFDLSPAPATAATTTPIIPPTQETVQLGEIRYLTKLIITQDHA